MAFALTEYVSSFSFSSAKKENAEKQWNTPDAVLRPRRFFPQHLYIETAEEGGSRSFPSSNSYSNSTKGKGYVSENIPFETNVKELLGLSFWLLHVNSKWAGAARFCIRIPRNSQLELFPCRFEFIQDGLPFERFARHPAWGMEWAALCQILKAKVDGTRMWTIT